MKKKIYQFIFINLLGWKIVGEIPSEIKKCVMIVVPHTSWYDFFLGVFTRGIVRQEMNFVAKKELFIFPFGYFFKWVGGAPLNRQKNENKVESIAKVFKEKEVFRLAIAPEGTRKKVNNWKTGFYYIAVAANVPIIPVAFDYKTKEVRIHKAFTPTKNIEADIAFLEQYYKGVEGKKVANGYEVK